MNNISFLMLLLLLVTLAIESNCDYWSLRAKILQAEHAFSLGGRINFTETERKANKILMGYKSKEWMLGFQNPELYASNLHFFEGKSVMEASPVFNIIKKLPKGASLHSHDTSMVSFEFLYNQTFRQKLYLCPRSAEKFTLRFLNSQKIFVKYKGVDCQLVENLRKNDDSFDRNLKEHLTLVRDEPEEVYRDINIVWEKFMDIFATVVPMISFKPLFEDYFYQVLSEFAHDNVKYMEFRSVLPPVYDFERHYGPVEVVGIYKNVLEKFQKANPSFQGAKVIYAPSRRVQNSTLKQYIKILHSLQETYPDFLAGFDLVGQEDLGMPLKNFIDDLLPLVNTTNFFFHAGETKWYGSTSDENLLDAVLLNTKRIGHGYALLKHPEVLRYLKRRRVAVEVAPISNQVLKLVDDVRNHPASVFFAFGLPVVVCNDDPGFWGASGLSYDWYMAFMGIASRDADLGFLKQLAVNSIQYSSMSNDDEKNRVLKQWTKDWEVFVKNLALEYNKYDTL